MLVPGCKDVYVSQSGLVITFTDKLGGVVLKMGTVSRGYSNVCIVVNGKRKYCLVHRLVAMTFIPNPLNKKQVNHIDGNKKNNNVTNLEWCTNQENMQHASKMGLLVNTGMKTGQRPISGKMAKDILAEFTDAYGQKKILTKKYNVSMYRLSNLVGKKSRPRKRLTQ